MAFRAWSSIAASWHSTWIISAGARARTISAYTHGIASSFPGQSGSWCGHATQVDSCGSHSAGMRYAITRPSSEVSLEDRPVGIDPPIAQERPVAARVLEHGCVAPCDQNVRRRPGIRDDAAERVTYERVPEELEAISARFGLVPDAVRG